MYHYKSNSILATAIDSLDDKTIFAAYKQQFYELTAKGFKPKLNIMDNQATKYIKKSSLNRNANCNLSSHTTNAPMQLNKGSKRGNMHILLRWQQPIVISHSNCGIS